MPFDIELWRKQAQALAAAAHGERADQSRVTTGEVRGAGLEADILAMPQLLIDPLQDSDGNFFFLADFSQVDGPDIIE